MPINPVLVLSAADWVARYHQQIPALMHRSAEFLEEVIVQGGIQQTIRRIGNTVRSDFKADELAR